MKSSTIIPFPILILFTLVSSLTPTLSDLNSDKQALLNFSSSISHSKRLNWNASTPVCSSWIGIACDPNETRVVSIRLPAIRLAGEIPPNTISKLDSLRALSLRSNSLSGPIPTDIPAIPSLQFLYLQHNNFSSQLPSSLSPTLVVLDLSFNSISGQIPPAIQNLTRLAKLSLQSNRISGTIPPGLGHPGLRLLNLSRNDLNGSIPNSLQKFPPSSFAENPLLCGTPLEEPCPAISKKNPKKNLGPDSIVALAIGCAAVLFLFALVGFICCLKRRRAGEAEASGLGKAEKPYNNNYDNNNNNNNNKDFGSGVHDAEKNKLFFFPGCEYSFDLEDLLRASAEILGKGNNGTTYKAVLDEGSTTVVVKRLKEVVAGKKDFEQQMEAAASVGRHRNVVPVRAYYYSKDEKLLVYDYLPSGSLFTHLHGFRGPERTPLDWETRVKISLGAARGIAHIHSSSSSSSGTGPRSVHGNIKSANILLGPGREAQVADFGLAPITAPPPPPVSSRALGYRAPEAAADSKKLTRKSDVYAFGVVLLEILTGKVPARHVGHDEAVDLPRWVRSVVREEWTSEVFDVEILRHRHVEEEMVQMLQIGLACVNRVPDSRPTMDQVVKMIQEISHSDNNNDDVDINDVKTSSTRPSSESDYSNNVLQTP